MILLVDNYDSFSYNLAQAFGSLGRPCLVRRPDGLDAAEVESWLPEALVISPGPGRPADFPVTMGLLDRFMGRIPVLGICLGHQCIAEALGGTVSRASKPVHGKSSDVFHDGRTVFESLRNPFSAARYHSLVVSEDGLPDALEISAFTTDGEVMGIRGSGLLVEGLQFHPESVATQQGMQLLRNFLDHYLPGGGSPVPASAGREARRSGAGGARQWSSS